MPDLPNPLTPPDCDLRGNDWMPMHGGRLFASHFSAHASDAEWRAGVTLWWAAWNQVPAASLPDDDVVLCRDAGLGRDMKAWQKVKAMAIWGFEKCNDGRLYHRFLAEEAVKAYALRLKADKKRETDRERLKAWREAHNAAKPGTDGNAGGNAGGNGGETPSETPSETGEKRDAKRVSSVVDKTRQDKTIDKPLIAPLSPLKRVAAHRGSRLPPEWGPSLADVAFAKSQNLDPVRTAEVFRDYWLAQPGARGVKQDWPATWRNWCRKDAETRSVAVRGRSPAGRQGTAAGLLSEDWRLESFHELDGPIKGNPQ